MSGGGDRPGEASGVSGGADATGEEVAASDAPNIARPEEEGEPAERLHGELARFPADLFQFDERMREGWLTDRYFTRTIETLAHAGRDPTVTMQFFGKKDGIVAGLYECVRMLQTQLWPGYAYEDLEVWTMLEGERVRPWEVPFRITGK